MKRREYDRGARIPPAAGTFPLASLKGCGVRPSTNSLPGIDLQDQVDLGAVVKLAYGFGVALVVVELSVDFVIDGRGERRETIGAVFADDISFYRAGTSVGYINNRIRKGIVVAVQDLSE